MDLINQIISQVEMMVSQLGPQYEKYLAEERYKKIRRKMELYLKQHPEFVTNWNYGKIEEKGKRNIF